MILNCNGVKGPSKQTAFHAMQDRRKPDIVHWCESKLCNSLCTYEFFPQSLTVFCKDHKVNGGVVFVLTTDRIISYDISGLDTDCEMFWTGLHFSGCRPLYLASFYEPNTTSQPLEAFTSS